MTKEIKKSKEKKVKKPAFQFDRSKSYPVAEAIELVKQSSRAKFDASVEVHVRLGIDVKKGDQQVRAAVALPHGTGKSLKIAAFVSADKEKAVKEAGAEIVGGEDLIKQIKETGKTDFQVAVAEPAMMKALAPVAKILGTRGLMPSPKNETVSADPAKTVAELKKGKASFKNDDTGNIHVIIGKVSFDGQKLTDNFQTFIDAVKKAKPAKSKGTYIKGIVMCSSMGPGIKVSL